MSSFSGPITVTGNSGSVIQIGDNNLAEAHIQAIAQEVKNDVDWAKVIPLLQAVRNDLNSLPEEYSEVRDTQLIPATAAALKEAKAQENAPQKANLGKFVGDFLKLATGLTAIQKGVEAASALFDKVREIAGLLGLAINL